MKSRVMVGVWHSETLDERTMTNKKETKKPINGSCHLLRSLFNSLLPAQTHRPCGFTAPAPAPCSSPPTMCNCTLFVLHISNYINAIIGWFLPYSIIHGIIAIVCLGSLNSSDIRAFHRDNGTWTFCLILASVFSLLWSVIWAVIWFITFFAIITIIFGILCIFAASATLYLMINT